MAWYGLIASSPLKLLISFVLGRKKTTIYSLLKQEISKKNTEHAKFCTHTKGHFDNNSPCGVFRKLRKSFLAC